MAPVDARGMGLHCRRSRSCATLTQEVLIFRPYNPHSVLICFVSVFQVALDGRKALEILNSRPLDFDLVLLDILMPGLDGIEVSVFLGLLFFSESFFRP